MNAIPDDPRYDKLDDDPRWVVCEECNGEKWVVVEEQEKECLRCGGTGKVENEDLYEF